MTNNLRDDAWESPVHIVVLGATGLLGRAVLQHLRSFSSSITAIGTGFSRANSDLGISKVDATESSEIRSFLVAEKPKVVINCIAERRPDVVENDKERARLLNVEMVENIAKICLEDLNNALFIHISTDYVFNGTQPPYKESDSTNPPNEYGLTKLQAEQAIFNIYYNFCLQKNVKEICNDSKMNVDKEIDSDGKSNEGIDNLDPSTYNYIILRVPVLYGPTKTLEESAVTILTKDVMTNSVSKSIDNWSARYPTFTPDVAQVVKELIHTKLFTTLIKNENIFHFSSNEEYEETIDAKDGGNSQSSSSNSEFKSKQPYTKYLLCKLMASLLPEPYTNIDHLIPDSEEPKVLPGAPIRPKDCHLDTSKLESFGIGTRKTSLKEGLTQTFKEAGIL